MPILIKNFLSRTLLLITIVILPICSFAENNSGNNDSRMVAAINSLNNKLEAWAKSINNATYQLDQSLPTIRQVNNASAISHEVFKQNLYQLDQNNIVNSLSQISDAALTYDNYLKTPEVLAALARIQYNQQRINNLTINLPASDTLYSAIPAIDTTAWSTGGYSLAKPTKLYNDYFDMGTLFSSSAYTPNQQNAAQGFLTFLSGDYRSLASGIDFDKLTNALNQIKKDPQKLATALHSLMVSTAFKTYQLNVRSALASRSVGTNNFNYLILERTPLETPKPNGNLATLSEAIGVTPGTIEVPNPTNPSEVQKMYTYASPLQISNYIANHRVDSAQWYENMKTASPATVQRETLFVLAEMESQMQQAHLDRERLLAALSALQLQTAASSQTLLGPEANNLNQEIDKISSSITQKTIEKSKQELKVKKS